MTDEEWDDLRARLEVLESQVELIREGLTARLDALQERLQNLRMKDLLERANEDARAHPR